MSTTTAEAETPETTGGDGPLLDLTDAAVKKFIKQAKARGYVTMDELNKVLPSEEVTSEAIEDTLAMLSEMGVNVVEAEEDAEGGGEVAVREESAVVETTKEAAYDRTDDPVRMYLREMGSVELLSREGEIAIAKRIEAGRDMMIGGIGESPLTHKSIVEWREKLKAGALLLRDIIDLDATMGGNLPEGTSLEGPGANFGAEEEEAEEAEEGAEGEPKPEGEGGDGAEEGEEANLSLAAMEQTLLPQVMETFDKVAALHKKLEKVQLKRLETIRAGEELNPRSEKAYEKQKLEMVELMRSVKLNNFRIEFLVEEMYDL